MSPRRYCTQSRGPWVLTGRFPMAPSRGRRGAAAHDAGVRLRDGFADNFAELLEARLIAVEGETDHIRAHLGFGWDRPLGSTHDQCRRMRSATLRFRTIQRDQFRTAVYKTCGPAAPFSVTVSGTAS